MKALQRSSSKVPRTTLCNRAKRKSASPEAIAAENSVMKSTASCGPRAGIAVVVVAIVVVGAAVVVAAAVVVGA